MPHTGLHVPALLPPPHTHIQTRTHTVQIDRHKYVKLAYHGFRCKPGGAACSTSHLPPAALHAPTACLTRLVHLSSCSLSQDSNVVSLSLGQDSNFVSLFSACCNNDNK